MAGRGRHVYLPPGGRRRKYSYATGDQCLSRPLSLRTRSRRVLYPRACDFRNPTVRLSEAPSLPNGSILDWSLDLTDKQTLFSKF